MGILDRLFSKKNEMAVVPPSPPLELVEELKQPDTSIYLGDAPKPLPRYYHGRPLTCDRDICHYNEWQEEVEVIEITVRRKVKK